MPSYAIIYGRVSNAMRRVIADDHGDMVLSVAPNAVTSVKVTQPDGTHSFYELATGEAALIVSVNGPAHGPLDWAAQLQNATGNAPTNPTCALVDNTNTVQHVICADAAIDVSPDPAFTMVQTYSPLITIGCTWDPVAQLFTAPGFTIPAGAAGNHGSALPKTVAAAVIARP